MRLKLIACEILYREMCAAVARSVHQVDVEFMPKGLHDVGQVGMSSRLAEAVAAVDRTQYDAILLGYALCSNGLVGLKADKIPLVVPRGHDCITLFLGSKERYLEYFQANPGVYFKTSGWIERGSQLSQDGNPIRFQDGAVQSYDDLVARYGEDNAKFLYEQLQEMTHNYGQLTFIETGIEPDDRFEQQTRDEAAARDWKFEKLLGDLSIVEALVGGDWDDERFLVVRPGHQIAASFDDGIIKAIPVES